MVPRLGSRHARNRRRRSTHAVRLSLWPQSASGSHYQDRVEVTDPKSAATGLDEGSGGVADCAARDAAAADRGL